MRLSSAWWACRRALGRALRFGPVAGVVWLLLLASWAGARSAADDVDIGGARRAEAMAEFIAARFGGELTRIKIRIVLLSAVFGVALGLVADALAWARRTSDGRRREHVLERLGVVAVLHAGVVAWSMADSPQLYSGRWYAVGGLRRTVEVLVTDVLGPSGVVVCMSALAIAYVRPAWVKRGLRRVLDPIERASLGRRSAFLVALVGGVVAVDARVGARATGGQPAALPREVRAPDGVSAGTRPSFLVIAADSLRADRLDATRAPTLAALAARGVAFDKTYVSLPRTFPSWVTLLTGRHPHHHKIRSMFPTWDERARDLDALPSRLARAGYRTGVVSDYAGDIFGRIDLGFELVDTPTFDFTVLLRQRALERETPLLPVLHSRVGRALFPEMRELADGADPELLATDAITALRRLSRGPEPFFLTVFFSTAHFPYAAPAPYYARYTDPSYRGRFKYKKPVGLGTEGPPDAADVGQIRGLYDGAVSAIDHAAGRLLEELRARGLSDRTIVLLTADHGETLYDHGHGQGHGDHLFGDEGTHIPLVLFDPRAEHSDRVGDIARDVDLAPTVYELAGVPAPDDLDGTSLAGALRGESIGDRLAFAETELWFTEDIPGLPADLRMPYPGIMRLTEIDSKHGSEIVLRKDMRLLTTVARHRMVRDGRYKLVYVPTRAGVRYLLFDTVADPGETIDVSAARPAVAQRLERELWRWMLEDTEMQAKGGLLVPREAGATRGRP